MSNSPAGMILIPRVSEKTYVLATDNVYVFEVPLSANKQEIADAVESQFKVSVVKVNVAIAKGKVKRSYRKGGGFVDGKRNDIKKAYVTLAEGDTIEVFEEAN